MTSLLVRVVVLVSCAVGLANAQQTDESLADVLGDVGTAEAVAGDGSTGTIYGQVFDGATGAPLQSASVILQHPDPGDGSDPHQEVAVTEIDGSYEFASVPPGDYQLTFIKAGYRASTMTGVTVTAGGDARADFPLPAVPGAADGDVIELDAFVVDASVVGEMMASLEIRMESDQLLNIMSSEDLSKYAASDVADALKRVAGVNIVEGQFAIIRG
ncbi:MAG: carboxypeptidase regulatory-like domain-containing protein, partial [Myxococcota bacterium]